MLAKLKTFSLVGIEAELVDVEVDVSPVALPKTILVGLPEAAVRESTHRVGRALVNSGYIRPEDRVVINLAPAELPKQAATFDLPMSLGMLVASGQLESDKFEHYAVVGELALEGQVAKRMPTILPTLTPSESIETTRIYSAVGRLPPGQPLMARRPFRSPHHTISEPNPANCADKHSWSVRTKTTAIGLDQLPIVAL